MSEPSRCRETAQPSPAAPGLPQPGGAAGPPARAAPCPEPTCRPVQMLLLLLRLVRTTQQSRSLGPSVNELPNMSPRAPPSHGASSAALSLLGGRMRGVVPAASSSHRRCTLLSPGPMQLKLMVRLIPGGIWIYRVAEGATHSTERVLVPRKGPPGSPRESSPSPRAPARGHPARVRES